jgi:glycerate dehydrogenase
MKKIVVLDGYTLNPGDLTWKDLEALGQYIIYDRTDPKEVVPRAKDAEIVLTNKTALSSDAIKQLPKLKYIGVLATGYNIVDTETARTRSIPVTNVPAYSTQSVAQMVFAHLLNLAQHVAHHAETVRCGRWTSNPDFCYWDMPLIELAGLTMGIIGFGRIGRAVAKLALAFGMKVIAYDIVTPPHQKRLSEALLVRGQFVELDDIFRFSDVISLHCPLTPQTKKIINKEHLELMKKTAYLVNTSRGPLVDEQALAQALNNERIAGAGLDVLSEEPPSKNNLLLKAKNCFITPHIAWATRAARERLLQVAVDNVASFLAGKPQNVVNGVRAVREPPLP